MTSKPDALITLGYHWADYIGTTLADAIAQCSSGGNPVLICTIGTRWKTTEATSTLGCHRNHTGWYEHQMVSQWRSSVNLHNWNTGRPLEAHWKHTGRQQLLIRWHSSLTSRHTGSPLDYHWLRVGESLFYTDTLTIQIKYGLPYCVTYPSMSTDPGSLNPGTRRSRVPGWWDPGIRTNTGTGGTVLVKHT